MPPIATLGAAAVQPVRRHAGRTHLGSRRAESRPRCRAAQRTVCRRQRGRLSRVHFGSRGRQETDGPASGSVSAAVRLHPAHEDLARGELLDTALTQIQLASLPPLAGRTGVSNCASSTKYLAVSAYQIGGFPFALAALAGPWLHCRPHLLNHIDASPPAHPGDQLTNLAGCEPHASPLLYRAGTSRPAAICRATVGAVRYGRQHQVRGGERLMPDYHVTRREDGWAAGKEGASRASSVHRTQAEAIDAAREYLGKSRWRRIEHPWSRWCDSRQGHDSARERPTKHPRIVEPPGRGECQRPPGASP